MLSSLLLHLADAQRLKAAAALNEGSQGLQTLLRLHPVLRIPIQLAERAHLAVLGGRNQLFDDSLGRGFPLAAATLRGGRRRARRASRCQQRSKQREDTHSQTLCAYHVYPLTLCRSRGYRQFSTHPLVRIVTRNWVGSVLIVMHRVVANRVSSATHSPAVRTPMVSSRLA